jgi:hypothetical protein
MLHPTVRAALDRHAEAFRDAKPFRYVVIDDFLDPELAQALLQSFPGFDAKYALNEMGQVGGKAVREHVRDLPKPYPELDAWLQTPDFLGAVSKITGIPDLLYDADYIGGGTHENVDGQGLDMHIDFNYHPGNRTHRRLNLIVYLNPEWEESWGGCIELAEDPWNPHNHNRTAVAPLFNRAVIFETNERSWHGFPRITLPEGKKSLSRRSFAIYLYTKERPAEETAPSHATVYVPEARPEHLVAGHTLTREDVLELDRRIAGARGQLHFLYEREKDFARQIHGLEYALNEARAAARLDLLGYARQIGAPEGFWPDFWARREAAMSFELVEPCKAAIARVWVPEALAGDFELLVDCNGQREIHHPRGGRVSELPIALKAKAGERVTLRFEANRDWTPSSTSDSADGRPLAFRLLDLRLQHG